MARAAVSETWATRRRARSGHVNATVAETIWRRLLLAVEHGESAAAVNVNTGQTESRAGLREFEPFFHAHQRDIFTYLWRMTGDEQAAYDLTQETFLRAWRHFAKVRDYERPGGWLFRVATHLALNHLRGRATALGKAVSLDTLTIANGVTAVATSADYASHIADADTVRRALMGIAPRHRAALVLREVYGFSCEEVAVALGVSTGAAKTLLWRARSDFRDRYREEAR
ncbi:MAG TPA: RNA polymerase sigma factor [Ktedonobacterales bacterium]|nr:RNA polymerase sigma factor [Ktedonobacterales bacterium]